MSILALASGCGDADVAGEGSSSTSAEVSGGVTTVTSDATLDVTSAGSSESTGFDDTTTTADDTGTTAGVVHVVLFTHIEDNTPAGTIGSPQNRQQYLSLRADLLELAAVAQSHGVRWTLQPDWKILLAALEYEDAPTTASTGGKNFLRYLVEDLDAVVDPHSHESQGYNYSDVAYLLEELGVGATTVIGGHIWDPSLPEFQEWDRFREPVAGEMYPEFSWRGDILIGAGTPNHVNDPLVSGVWRPANRDDFFTDDPRGNIVAVGGWRDELAGVEELVGLVASGAAPSDRMLTASWNMLPTSITAEGGVAALEQDVLLPLAAMRDAGSVVLTDFTTLVATWQSDYGGEAYLFEP
jgi:hypothetical protein